MSLGELLGIIVFFGGMGSLVLGWVFAEVFEEPAMGVPFWKIGTAFIIGACFLAALL